MSLTLNVEMISIMIVMAKLAKITFGMLATGEEVGALLHPIVVAPTRTNQSVHHLAANG
ncbi:hypothetical protein [Marinoscillum sp.]|uniref:hypothetical protein n=1 Tax=Marinoscillum sp. TaxID=2024838 RepID=UPI003BAC1DF3